MAEQSALTFKASERLIAWLARRQVSQAIGHGVSLPYDDAYQEVSLIWLKCVRSFEPGRGVKFSAYFARSVQHEHHRICQRTFGDGYEVTGSLHEEVHGEADGQGAPLIDMIEDQSIDDLGEMLDLSRQVEAVKQASPLIRRMAEIGAEPDEEMQAEIAALRAKKAWGANFQHVHGSSTMAQVPTTLTLRMVGRSMRFNWRDKLTLNNAIKDHIRCSP